MKEKIREVIVVEGRHDSAVLRRYFDCDTIETGGDALNEEKLEEIALLAQKRGIIVFTDPDSPGEHIRRQIQARVPDARHAFIEKRLARTDKKVGVEHASKQDLWNSLQRCVTFMPDRKSISWSEYIDLGLASSMQKREKLCARLHISRCNSKTCFKRLNALGVDARQARHLLEEEQ